MSASTVSAPTSLAALLDEIASRGYSLSLHLTSDSRPASHRWEARVTRRLPEQTPDGYISATGSYSASTAELALDSALDLCENDYERLEPTPLAVFDPARQLAATQPASVDISSLLRNLRPPTAPVFLRRL